MATPLPRRPLLWLVAAECVIVLGLGIATWRVIEARRTPPPPAVAEAAPPPADAAVQPTAPPAPSALPPASPSPRPAPAVGLSTDPAFLRRQLVAVNRDEASLEQVEWRLAQAVLGFARTYIDEVVLPAIDRARRGGRT